MLRATIFAPKLKAPTVPSQTVVQQPLLHRNITLQHVIYVLLMMFFSLCCLSWLTRKPDSFYHLAQTEESSTALNS
ncbi:unnamed protein product [Lathyrus oleraceus]